MAKFEDSADRSGQFEHPVIISVLDGRGMFIEQVVCINCAEEGGFLARRPTAVTPGVTCPGCNANLCPS
jgi:hypothetical protein